MAQPKPRERTFDELYREIELLPAGSTGEILVPGTLRVMSRPGRRHRRIAKHLPRLLGPIDADSGGTGWWIEIEPEIRFGRRLFVPDLAGWRVERVAELPEENPITIAPDWACEILSPSTARDDRHVKLPVYVESGVGHVWLVDPETRLVEVFEASNGAPRLVASAVEDESPTLPPFGLAIPLATLWIAQQTTEAPR